MAILVHIPGIPGDSKLQGFDKKGGKEHFHADSFSFGIEREAVERGGKGGTEDINIGVGELQECVITKGLDSSSSHLAQAAVNGNTFAQAEVYFVEIAAAKKGMDVGVRVYLGYKLDRCAVAFWSTEADADNRPVELVGLHFNRIAFSYAAHDGTNWVSAAQGYMGWDKVENKVWDQKQAAIRVGSGWKPS